MNSKAETCYSISGRGWTGGVAAGPASQKGFTIIEVMVAIAILSVGMLAAWALQYSSTRGNTSSRNLTLSASCASDRLEQLIQLPYAHADLSAANIHTPAQDADGIDNNFNGEIDEPGETGPLRISWQVTDDTPIPQTKTIRVDVSLRQRTVSVTSYRANL
jgi:prepilin-type N-terminal cleavage/methylation domain-containing protein